MRKGWNGDRLAKSRWKGRRDETDKRVARLISSNNKHVKVYIKERLIIITCRFCKKNELLMNQTTFRKI